MANDCKIIQAEYIYEIRLRTAYITDAACDSNVFIEVVGTNGTEYSRQLHSDIKHSFRTFRHGQLDSFVMASRR